MGQDEGTERAEKIKTQEEMQRQLCNQLQT